MPGGVSMKMLIVESKAKAKTIQKYLGKNYLVRASNGHVQDLPTGKHKDARKAMWASKEDSLPQPPWDFTERAKKTVDMLQNDANKSNNYVRYTINSCVLHLHKCYFTF